MTVRDRVHGFDARGAKRITDQTKMAEGTGPTVNVPGTNTRGRAGGGFLLGKTSGSHAVGAIQSVDLYAGPHGTETATGETLDALNRFVLLSGGVWVLLAFIGRGWEIVTADPCA